MDWNKLSGFANIGTFVLTVVVVFLMVLQLLLQPSQTAVQGAGSMTPWILPSILCFCILAAAALHLKAASLLRQRKQEQPSAQVDCGDTWLHKIAQSDKQALGARIKFLKCEIVKKDLTGALPSIEFCFSYVDVLLDDDLDLPKHLPAKRR